MYTLTLLPYLVTFDQSCIPHIDTISYTWKRDAGRVLHHAVQKANCTGLLIIPPHLHRGEDWAFALTGLWSVVVLGLLVMTMATGGMWPIPLVPRALPAPSGCSATAWDSTRYGPSERIWLLPAPIREEWKGVELGGPVSEPANRAAVPHSIPWMGDTCGVFSKPSPPPRWGEAWDVSPLPIPLSVGKNRGFKADEVASSLPRLYRPL